MIQRLQPKSAKGLTMSDVLKGGCCCGAIRYEVADSPTYETICHCQLCRGTTGAPVVAWFTAARDSVRLTGQEPARFNSSANGVRSFCSICGTQILFSSADHPHVVDVTIASLDDPARVPPRSHTFVRSKLAWMRISDGLEEYDGAEE